MVIGRVIGCDGPMTPTPAPMMVLETGAAVPRARRRHGRREAMVVAAAALTAAATGGRPGLLVWSDTRLCDTSSAVLPGALSQRCGRGCIGPGTVASAAMSSRSGMRLYCASSALCRRGTTMVALVAAPTLAPVTVLRTRAAVPWAWGRHGRHGTTVALSRHGRGGAMDANSAWLLVLLALCPAGSGSGGMRPCSGGCGMALLVLACVQAWIRHMR